MNELGIYIHIPFCRSKCFYCDFCSFDNKDEIISNYIDALINEILSYSEIISSHNVTSIYLGGGTPTYIDSKYIVKILDVLKLIVPNNVSEITIECNPNTITDEKVKDYISSSINRFSIGVQSIYDNVLKSIGRTHTYQDTINALNILNKNNVSNISIDIIYPLPNLSLDMFKKQIDEIIKFKDKFGVKHISVYNLELHENTKLKFLIDEKYLTLPSEDEEYEMKEYMESALNLNGFKKYEISNFSLPSFEAIHNTLYWRQKEYIGIGLNASSFLNSKRYTNTDNINDYIDLYLNLNKNINIIKFEEQMDKLELMKEYVLLNLRLTSGVNIDEFKTKFKVEIFNIFGTEFKELIDKKLVLKSKNKICLTKRGFEIANQVFEYFV